ncbi:MAG TPA: Npt1/Npt2 family nucleotide transporter, partial [bacterium]|nr:Npt1/Npt2 family nucleotide transporter [bacterium]
PLLDERTQLMGQVYGVVNTANMVLHALTGVILRLAGIPITMSVIPVMLAFSLGAFIAIPSLICIAIVKISSKVLDYTLFRSARECLYIPLSHEERTQGKSVVDMIVNRVGKVGASFIVMGLISAGVTELVSWMGLFLILIWTILAIVITRRFRKLVSRKEELS